MGKRCICIALVLILVTTIGLAPLAQPAEAVAGVVVAGAVVAVMAMAGITIVTSGMTAAQIQDWVEDKLEEWAADVGSPLDHLINSAGIGVTISGLLTIGTAAAQGINQFIDWLKTDLGLSNNSTQNVISSGSLTDIFTITSAGTGYYNLSGTTVFINANGNSYFDFDMNCSSSNIEFDFVATGNNHGNQGTLLFISWSPLSYTNLSGVSWNGRDNGLSPGVVGNFTCSGHCSFTGTTKIRITEQVYSSVTVVLTNFVVNDSPVSGSTLSLGTGVITLPQVNNDDKVFLDVGALPGSTASEVTEGVFTDVAADTLDVSGTVAEEEPEYVITGPVSVSGLDDIFPFCIPFDLYHMCEALAADPVAPHFEWRFYVPRIVDYTIVIDLSGFNTVAQILRVMETLLFCVGLAFETRKLIRS